jgi:hypothetical protein
MWQVHTLPDGEKIVSSALSERITAIFQRTRDARIFINLVSNEVELRLFDKRRLPILTIDGEHVTDFNGLIDIQRNLPNQIFYFAEDRSVCGVIW